MLFLCIETLLQCLYPQFNFTPILVIGGVELFTEVFFILACISKYIVKLD